MSLQDKGALRCQNYLTSKASGRVDFFRDGFLAYINKRMIGRVGLAQDAADFVAAEKLGPDALDLRFDFDAFRIAVLGLKRAVKSVLMDQKIVAGIGNIQAFKLQAEPTFLRSLSPANSTQLEKDQTCRATK